MLKVYIPEYSIIFHHVLTISIFRIFQNECTILTSCLFLSDDYCGWGQIEPFLHPGGFFLTSGKMVEPKHLGMSNVQDFLQLFFCIVLVVSVPKNTNLLGWYLTSRIGCLVEVLNCWTFNLYVYRYTDTYKYMYIYIHIVCIYIYTYTLYICIYIHTIFIYTYYIHIIYILYI